MKQAEMEVYEDAVGNVFGRVQGEQDGVILTGSHLDTVKNAVSYTHLTLPTILQV